MNLSLQNETKLYRFVELEMGLSTLTTHTGGRTEVGRVP